MILRSAFIATIALLSVPAFGSTIFSPNDPSLQGTVIASQTVPVLSALAPPGPDLLIDEKVVQTAAGTLDFYYKILNPPNQSSDVRDFGVYFSQNNPLQLEIGYVDEGNLAPSRDDLTTIGGTTYAGWHFGSSGDLEGPPLPDAGSDWLLLRSNASNYTTGTLTADRGQDDFLIPAAAFTPDANSVPEPTILSSLSLAIACFIIKLRRQ